jgi:hypothetical protein
MTSKHASVVLLLAMSLVGSGCESKTTGQPKVLGVRQDAQGKVLAELVCQTHQDRAGIAPGPHGLGPLSITNWSECWLREPGKPDRPLPFLRDVLNNPFRCRPVAGTSYWVTVTSDHDGHEQNLRILAFDESGILRRRILDYFHAPASTRYEVYFRDGNRKLIFRAASGFIEYDLITNEKKACNEPAKIPADDE